MPKKKVAKQKVGNITVYRVDTVGGWGRRRDPYKSNAAVVHRPRLLLYEWETIQLISHGDENVMVISSLFFTNR